MEEEYEGQFMETLSAEEFLDLLDSAIQILENIMDYGEECYNKIVRSECNIPETQAKYLEYVEALCASHPVVSVGIPDIAYDPHDYELAFTIQSKADKIMQLGEKIELNNIIICDF